MQRTRTVSAALVAVVLGLAACGEGSSSEVADERGSAPAQTEERAPTTEPDSPDSIPADQAGGDEEQVRAVLTSNTKRSYRATRRRTATRWTTN